MNLVSSMQPPPQGTELHAARMVQLLPAVVGQASTVLERAA